jgi:hypothetical protein
MVPIVSERIDTDRVSIYSQGAGLSNPLAGLRLRNTTGLHLGAGPYTVFEGGEYAGDARASEIVPGENRLMTYAVDRELLVLTDTRGKEARAVKLHIENGTFIYTEISRREHVYRVVNRSGEEKTLVIEHPKFHGWTIVSPDLHEGDENGEVVSETPSHYRFERAIPAAGTGRARESRGVIALTIEEKQPHRRSIALSSLDTERITFYLENYDMTAELERAFERVRAYRSEITRLEDAIERNEEDIEDIHDDQSRIRSNMSRLDERSDLYRRYVRKLGEQEDRIETLMVEQDSLEESLAGALRELNEFLEGLSVGES